MDSITLDTYALDFNNSKISNINIFEDLLIQQPEEAADTPKKMVYFIKGMKEFNLFEEVVLKNN